MFLLGLFRGKLRTLGEIYFASFKIATPPKKKGTMYMQPRFWIRSCLLIFVIICTASINIAAAEEPEYEPLIPSSLARFIEQKVRRTMLPLNTATDDGINLTVHDVQQMTVDWDTGSLSMNINFSANVESKWLPFPVQLSGSARVTGCGLVSVSSEQIGARFIEIDDLRLNGTYHLLQSPIKYLLNRRLSGKECWSGTTPEQYEVLTISSVGKLLRLALEKQLPIQEKQGKNSFQIFALRHLEKLPEPGVFSVGFEIKGERKGLIDLSFDGDMEVIAEVRMATNDSKGQIYLREISVLNLRRSPAWLDGMIRRSINEKLQNQAYAFSW